MSRCGHGFPTVSLGSTMQAGHPCNGLMAVSEVAQVQSGRPAAVFYPLEHPMLYINIFPNLTVSENERTSDQGVCLTE
jgi:hypothetical protein